MWRKGGRSAFDLESLFLRFLSLQEIMVDLLTVPRSAPISSTSRSRSSIVYTPSAARALRNGSPSRRRRSS